MGCSSGEGEGDGETDGKESKERSAMNKRWTRSGEWSGGEEGAAAVSPRETDTSWSTEREDWTFQDSAAAAAAASEEKRAV